ncbi:dicarboxylate/amino acid:cation symporter [Fluviispira multicolorata]|uniref:Cation:dicarboxylase symporter family transporter n=1 Tax=Fluviispira multicolorata TaxID=2654512 RepID=A0A833JFF4_9BACT|nr:dicarboxylate/amino acid:cation symporter [Fluviispira multicolorata]KAB8033275.1 cation:dicarboxylase symporter family transporter [Fluviispira multicolorata]
MTVIQISKKKNLYKMPFIYLTMISLGVFCGLSNIESLHTIGLFISDLFIKIFKCISIPIISLSLIVTLSNYSSQNSMKSIWQRTLFYTFATTLIAATVSALLYYFIKPSNVSFTETITAPVVNTQTSYLQHISNIIPANIIAPFLENQVMSVLLLSILAGIAIRFIPDEEAKKTITQFFKGAHGLFLVLTKWIVTIIPLGLFGFVTTTVIQLRGGMDMKGVGEFLAVIVLANVIQGFVILPLWLKLNGVRPFQTMRGMLPALSLAFFSKSSAGTLPVTMESAEKNVKINPIVSRFVLPLCTSINMNGCAAFIFTTVIFLMQNNGADITVATMGLWIIISTIAAVGNAGVPMGCFFLSASLLASMNVPIVLLAVILPFYSIIDMVETSLNVWSDSCVAKVVNDKVKFKLTELEKVS